MPLNLSLFYYLNTISGLQMSCWSILYSVPLIRRFPWRISLYFLFVFEFLLWSKFNLGACRNIRAGCYPCLSWIQRKNDSEILVYNYLIFDVQHLFVLLYNLQYRDLQRYKVWKRFNNVKRLTAEKQELDYIYFSNWTTFCIQPNLARPNRCPRPVNHSFQM